MKIKIAIIVIGGLLCLYGYRELSVARGTEAEPKQVDLETLEGQSGEIENPYLSIGTHTAVHRMAVFRYMKPLGGDQPKNDSSIEYVVYPIVSMEHPYSKEYLAATKGRPVRLMIDTSRLPDLENFKVLVKTKRFEIFSNVPKTSGTCANVTGLVVNRIDKLEAEARELIQEGFPTLDLNKVLILEEGRKPKSSTVSLVTLAFGAIILVAGSIWLVIGFMKPIKAA